MGDGDFFDPNSGAIKTNQGLQYYKSKEWKLEPERKGPVPSDVTYELPEGTQTFPTELFSIDGESFPA